MNEDISKVIASILGNEQEKLAKAASQRTLDDVTFHDFAKYEFILDPKDALKLDLEPLSARGIEYINDLEASGSNFAILEYMADLLIRLEATVKRACEDGLPASIQPGSFGFISSAGLFEIVMKPLYTLHRKIIIRLVDYDREYSNYFESWVYIGVKSSVQNRDTTQLLPIPDVHYYTPLFDWVALLENNSLVAHNFDLENELEYSFDFYPPGSVNVGVALIYRQRWKSIGTQPGEIIKTIPLGPGQSEKIVTKIKSRKKMTSQRDSLVESESSNESTDSSKDSTEVVAEAASKENWSLSASASYGIGSVGFGASASGEMGGSKEKSSKNTSSSLSEKMKKTASKMRRQTKVSITTETESEFEESSNSEVKNNNDEVALTLQYHMLQHQYEVYTYLFSVKNAIFVAEKVPAPYEVNLEWVRRHDWIIAEELIDESYRNTLNELIQDEDIDSLVSFTGSNNPYSSMINKANDSFAIFNTPGNPNGLGGLNVPDIYAEPQRQFDSYRKGEESRLRALKIRLIKRTRLINHIKDNILHYCRAIWAREDAEQRMFRYQKEGRTVPLIWEGTLLDDQINANFFEPTPIRAALHDVVKDISPIGFTGNYIVFELAPVDFETDDLVDVSVDTENGSIKLPLQEVLNIVRSEYTNTNGTGLQDPAFNFFLKEANGLPQAALANLNDDTVLDFASFLPRLNDQLFDDNNVKRKADKSLQYDISKNEWAEYLFKKNATRRFLVDSNNLYVSLVLGDGVALEPFKRAHRFIDVLNADEMRKAEVLKNERRALLKAVPNNFDPDISKVVVASNAQNEDLVGGLLEDDQN